MRTVYFALKDADGVEHAYDVEVYSAKESVSLQVMIAQPLLEVVGKIGGVLSGAMAKGDAPLEKRIEALGSLQMQGLLTSLPAIPRMIEERGGYDLITRILKRTVRHSTAKDSAGGNVDLPMRLSDPEMMDLAYGDGNYLEMWSAVFSVLAVNFTRLGRNGSLDWKQLLSGATGGLLKPSHPTIGTAKPSAASTSGSA